MGDPEETRSYSFETVRALMHYRDVELVKRSAELAAIKVSHQKLAQIAYSIINLDRTSDSMDVVSEGIRPIAEEAREALARDREAARLVKEIQPR